VQENQEKDRQKQVAGFECSLVARTHITLLNTDVRLHKHQLIFNTQSYLLSTDD